MVETHDVVIIGAGFSGLGVAMALRDAGVDDFVLLEKAQQCGGTWRDNTYPGCACDVPSHLYSFSKIPWTWSRVFAGQPEIQQYLLHVVERENLRPRVRFGHEVERASWEPFARRWVVQTSRGTLHARVLVSATGPLHEPKTPAIPGLDQFEGTVFHSARWDHDHDLTGKRVAVVGTGSSAIQFVPKIQPRADHLVLFQRTAPWVLPKPDHRYHALQRWMFEHVPGFRWAYRGALYMALEGVQQLQQRARWMDRLGPVALKHLHRQVPDLALREMLTPRFTLGCKRLLLSNTYYPALQQPNVSVVGHGLEEVSAHAVLAGDGTWHEVDAIVLGTGFRVTDPPIAERIYSGDGKQLSAQWSGSPRAYLGTSVDGFPNLFFMIGPNLGNGHSSAFVLIELQANYIASALRWMRETDNTAVVVESKIEREYNTAVQSALQPTVWNAGGCSSYYLDVRGTNSSIYPWSTLDLRRRMRKFDPADYTVVTAAEHGTTRTDESRGHQRRA
ncbi:MAG: flavin-containing monooxygenase [Nannocystales bacterium]